MKEIKKKGKIWIIISKFGWSNNRVYHEDFFLIKNEETVNFDNKACQYLFKNLGVKEKSTQDSHYNDLLKAYPYVRYFFKNNSSIIEACKNGVIDNIDLHISIELDDGFGYRHALHANINKDGSSNVKIYPPFEKQAAERSISNEKDSIIEKDNKVEKKKDKYPLVCYGILYLMLGGVLVGLIRAIYYLIINYI